MTAHELSVLMEIKEMIDDILSSSEWMTIEEAVEATGLSARQIRYRSTKGIIPRKKVGCNALYLIPIKEGEDVEVLHS